MVRSRAQKAENDSKGKVLFGPSSGIQVHLARSLNWCGHEIHVEKWGYHGIN